MDPFRLLLISLAGWVNEHQEDVIEYLQEENVVLREQGRKYLGSHTTGRGTQEFDVVA